MTQSLSRRRFIGLSVGVAGAAMLMVACSQQPGASPTPASVAPGPAPATPSTPTPAPAAPTAVPQPTATPVPAPAAQATVATTTQPVQLKIAGWYDKGTQRVVQ